MLVPAAPGRGVSRPPGGRAQGRFWRPAAEVILVHETKAFRCRAGPRLRELRAALQWDRAAELGDLQVDLLAWEKPR